MKNTYTARFYDYYGWEFTKMTKAFSTLIAARNYFVETCENNAIPFAQLDRNEQAISLSGHRIGADCDSRQFV